MRNARTSRFCPTLACGKRLSKRGGGHVRGRAGGGEGGHGGGGARVSERREVASGAIVSVYHIPTQKSQRPSWGSVTPWSLENVVPRLQ